MQPPEDCPECGYGPIVVEGNCWHCAECALQGCYGGPA